MTDELSGQGGGQAVELSPRMPDLGALQLLLSVARLGSLGAAAAAHGISQPAASSRIRYMERLVGLPLLVRRTRGSDLTSEGVEVARWAAGLLEHAAVVDAAIADLKRLHEAHLRVAASTTIAQFMLPAWLNRARTAVAVAAGVMNSQRVMAAVLAGEADLGFVEGPATRHGLTARVVAVDRLVVVVGQGHPWAARRHPLSGQELAGTALLQREPGSGTREALEAALAHVGPLAPAAWECSSTPELLQAAARGQAPAVLSRLVVHSDVARGRLVPVACTGFTLRRQLRAVWTYGQPLRRTQRDFLAIAGRREASTGA